MELARFDIAGLSAANVEILQPGVTVSYSYSPIGSPLPCLVSFSIPVKYLGAENNGLRLMVPSLNTSFSISSVSPYVDYGSIYNDGALSANLRVRAHDNFIVSVPSGKGIAIDFGVESLDVSAGQQNNVSLVEQYLFNGGYHGGPLPAETTGEIVVTFLSDYVEGSYVSASSSGITLSAFKLPRPINFWITPYFAKEQAVYKTDVF